MPYWLWKRQAEGWTITTVSKPLDDRAQDHWETVCAVTRMKSRTGPSFSKRLARRTRRRIGAFLVGAAVRLAGPTAGDALLAGRTADLPG